MTSTTSQPESTIGRTLVGLLAPAVATLVALAILVALGAWQLDRKAWKEGLLAQIAARAHGEPVTIPREGTWPEWRAVDDEYRRVRLTGTFRHDLTAPVNGLAEVRRGQALQGVYLFTPLTLDDGATVMVNRGFVPVSPSRPDEWKDAAQPAGHVSVTGLLRAPETRGSFVPANDPARNAWFVRSLDDMARARGLSRLAPFYVDADATPNPGGWPRGGQTQLTLKNDHLHYALTWFGLGAALLGVFAAFAWRRFRPGTTAPVSATTRPA